MKRKFAITAFVLCLVMALCIIQYGYMNLVKQVNTWSNDNYDDKDKECCVKKDVYLTFDDGPSNKTTDKILDILKEKKVRATFFLVGSKIKGREDIIKRIYRQKSGIGLHTYSHVYNKIYRSNDTFIKEMQDTELELKNIIGKDPKIIRFPGGSSKKINKGLLKKIRKNHYKIFDWNITTEDGINNKVLPYKLYKEATKVNPKLSRYIILMHCAQENASTCKALPSIIDFYKKSGCNFKVINEKTEEYIFRTGYLKRHKKGIIKN